MNETVLNETYEKNLSDRLLKERKIMAFGRLDEKAAEKMRAEGMECAVVGEIVREENPCIRVCP